MDVFESIFDSEIFQTVNEFFSPLLTVLKQENIFKNVVLGVQLILALIFLISYSKYYFNGQTVITKSKNTLIYSLLNLFKVLIYGYLLFIATSRENFDYNVQGEEPVVTPLILPNPNLAISLSAEPQRVLPGKTITYSLTLRNQGNVDADNIIMINKIPEGTSFISSDIGKYQNDYVTWRKISLSPGETYNAKYIVGVDENFEGANVINDTYFAYNI